MRNKRNDHTHHADGLVTLTSAPTAGISSHMTSQVDMRNLTEEEREAYSKNKSFWDDKRREREMYE